MPCPNHLQWLLPRLVSALLRKRWDIKKFYCNIKFIYANKKILFSLLAILKLDSELLGKQYIVIMQRIFEVRFPIWNFSIVPQCCQILIYRKRRTPILSFYTKKGRRNSLSIFRVIEYAIRHHSATFYHDQTVWISKNGYCIVFKWVIFKNFISFEKTSGHEQYQNAENIHKKTHPKLWPSVGFNLGERVEEMKF